MNRYTEKMKQWLMEMPSEYGGELVSALEMLYLVYSEFHTVSTPVIRERFAQLDESTRILSLEQNDAISDIVCDLCTEHERAAFYEGVRVGARLAAELAE